MCAYMSPTRKIDRIFCALDHSRAHCLLVRSSVPGDCLSSARGTLPIIYASPLHLHNAHRYIMLATDVWQDFPSHGIITTFQQSSLAMPWVGITMRELYTGLTSDIFKKNYETRLNKVRKATRQWGRYGFRGCCIEANDLPRLDVSSSRLFPRKQRANNEANKGQTTRRH